MILAIDPGSENSGLAHVRDDYRPYDTSKLNNHIVLTLEPPKTVAVVIEMVGHYGTGMPAGKDVFDTCVWIGRFIQHFTALGLSVTTMMRAEVKMNL